MKGKHPLVTHPVGRLKAAARWYMAAIAMMTLVLVAIHFAMQVYAQEEAKRLVYEWQKRTGITVADVRYRMLRGALTLIDVRYSDERIQAHLPMLFLQGNLTSLTADQPHANAIEVRDARLDMTIPAFASALQGAAGSLSVQLWRSAQSVGVYDTSIELLPDPESLFPQSGSRIELVRLVQTADASQREIKAVARLFDGEVEVEAGADVDDRGVTLRSGHIAWSGCDMASLLAGVAGLEPLMGRSNGSLNWQPDIDRSDVVRISGSSGINAFEGSPRKAVLEWDGELDHGIWRGKGRSEEWPLAMFAGQLPKFQELSIADGRLDGSFTLSGSFRNWKLNVETGHLSDLRFRSEEASQSRTEWRIGSADVSKAEISWPEKRIAVSEAGLNKATIALDGSAKAADPEWRISVNRILFNSLTPSLSLADREILLPSMQGEASLSQAGNFRLRLNSSQPENEVAGERWKVSGEGDLYSASASRFTATAEARSVPLVRFRPLMPEMIRREARDISGEVELDLRLLAGSAPWEASGGMVISNAGLQYDSGKWRARKMSIGVEKAGRELPLQLFERIEIDGWAYEAAIHPLGAPRQAGEVEVVPAATTHAEPWHIREVLLRDGTVSVGYADAIWLSEAELKVTDLYPGNAAPFEFRAVAGGGSLALGGTLAWNEAVPDLTEAKISLRDALPFFLNDWLAVSEAPRIVRGRLYADIKAAQNAEGIFEGQGFLRLQNGQLGPALSGDDPLLLRVGMNSHDVFSVLQKGGRVRLTVPLRGSGHMAGVLADSFIEAIRVEVDKHRFATPVSESREGARLASVRLHEEGSLSQNERTRLRTAMRYMLKNPKSRVELRPQLAVSTTLDEQVGRVRYTQQLIENFLNARGIQQARIYPVWPVEQHRSSGSSSGVNIYTIP